MPLHPLLFDRCGHAHQRGTAFSGQSYPLGHLLHRVLRNLGKSHRSLCRLLRIPVAAVIGSHDVRFDFCHAAGSIAMVMVGMNLLVGPNTYLVNDDMLNGVVMMILCTCVISSMLTDWSSRKIILRDKELPDAEDTKKASDEKILIPVKYPEYADNLMSLAFLVRNQKLNRGLVCLNVVYDDKDMRYKQEQGRQLLDHCSQLAAATDVMTQTQVRIAANIANGINMPSMSSSAQKSSSACTCIRRFRLSSGESFIRVSSMV